ncbi:MAG: hypothetical protein ABFD25_22730 [Clostridiaceae bacterium]
MARQYTHPLGWKDNVNFPTTPADEPLTRALLQEQHDEILGFHNDLLADFDTHRAKTVADADGVHGLKIESGTFTPVLSASNVPTGVVYAAQSGKYVKQGNLVHFVFQIQITNAGSGGGGLLIIGGLPFANSNIRNAVTISIVQAINIPAGYFSVSAYIQAAQPDIYFTLQGINQARLDAGYSMVGNDFWVEVSGEYESL